MLQTSCFFRLQDAQKAPRLRLNLDGCPLLATAEKTFTTNTLRRLQRGPTVTSPARRGRHARILRQGSGVAEPRATILC